ncbi:D-alanyl-D-alanine carboxypeptidase [Paracoccus tibetensis]|uniref:D-alanyl-D-alanine carboxypeptidase / D-alanyl-D-alanine-endopeptidase (Penicillin-binding protein 4) n=1 Tax=Paracoccus tibetensis TaxID=336292 RepID=A0A1G5H4K6_9RHOB|nr:D-alanyl-D-alanine carboxypeptidase [Paracoccus tibetensis]SCY58644.1 D-alanyl-D-alanine carboxypeptidase / D-alanyl-D-alanine-endopeptidase (penicillin-binding protein 4) [Paracoccus tibetensis]
MLDRRMFLAAAAATLATPALAERRPPPKPAPDARRLTARVQLPGQVAFALLGPDGQAGPQDLALATAAIAPASTMKAITALYVLDRVGPERRFQTQVIRAGDMLILAGGGDPVLSTDDLGALAAQLAARGEAAPARFGVWGGALPTIPRIAPEQAEHLPYNPALSGMMLNFNRVHLGWTRAGEMSVEARGAAASPRAFTITAAAASQPQLFAYRQEAALEHWTVQRAALGGGGSRWLPVRLPELHAGDVFQTLCRARGFALPAPEVLDRLPQGEVIARHDSPLVGELIRDMLRYSTNITAEVLGLHASGAPDLPASGQRMLGWLNAAGLGQGMVLADHSGLGATSRMSVLEMARVMAGPGREMNLASLLRQNPLEGDPSGGPIRGEVAAKTGTLNFVSNLAGFVTSPSGRQGSFAIFCVDPARRDAAIGQEMPAGVSQWTRSAKAVQRDLLAAFAARLS